MEHRSHLYRPLTEAEFGKLIFAVFHTGDYQANLIEGGLFNTTYRATVSDARYILRIGPVNRHLLIPYENHLMAAEAFAYRYLQNAGIPTSDVVCCDCTRLLIDRDYMVVRAAEGEMLSKLNLTDAEKDAVYADLGRYVKRLHGIDMPMFGRLSAVLQGRGAFGWYEALRGMYTEWKAIARTTPDLFSEEDFARYERVLRENRALFDEITAPKLTHCDLWENNVLAKRENGAVVITALIDIDRAVCGDPDFEFGYDFMLTDAFKAGYGFSENERTVRRRNLYRMLCQLNDAYIWQAEYQNPQNARDCKKAAEESLQAIRQEDHNHSAD